MRITQESDYALRIIEYLASSEESRVGANVIAAQQKIPLRFALKILRKLNAAGITKAYRGVTGGYTLIKTPGDISFRDVIEAVEGSICINKCLMDGGACNRNMSETCTIHNKLARVQDIVIRELDAIRFI